MSAPERRARILAAALDRFAAGGYRATSMDEIADRAGVTRAVLYDHFASKKALFLVLLEDQDALFLGHVGARISGTGSAEERMRATMATVFDFAERHPETWRLLFGNRTHGDQEVDDVAIHVHRRRLKIVGRLLAPDMGRAGIDPESPRAKIMVGMLIAALCGAADWRREHPEATLEHLVEAGTDLLWTGLGQLEP
jgi:AcrR family transcriptional regulator